jgi:hypothetical protein
VEGYLCNILKPQGSFCKKVGGGLVDHYGLLLTWWFDRSESSVPYQAAGSSWQQQAATGAVAPGGGWPATSPATLGFELQSSD